MQENMRKNIFSGRFLILKKNLQEKKEKKISEKTNF